MTAPRSLHEVALELLYGPEHKLGTRVPLAGASCATCSFAKIQKDGPHCMNRLWQLWPKRRGGGGGRSHLPVMDGRTFCCDLWDQAK